METVLSSPAKVNLTLRVLGKRDDGFHEISSLMQPLSLADRIIVNISDGDGISISCDNPTVPIDERNLVHIAASLFLEKAELKRQVDIDIIKKIPVGGGMGGGSSNAATLLMGLNELCDRPFDEQGLLELAASIGSDVPFFILESPAVARGRGELLERVTLPPLSYLLINPGFEVSAGWAYTNLGLTKSGKNNNLMYLEKYPVSPKEAAGILYNDLERPVLKAHPDLIRYKCMISEHGALATLMSGSGPTVFGIFDGPAGAKAALNEISGHLDASVLICTAEGLAGLTR